MLIAIADKTDKILHRRIFSSSGFPIHGGGRGDTVLERSVPPLSPPSMYLIPLETLTFTARAIKLFINA